MVVHLLKGWSGRLLEVNPAGTGVTPSLVVAAGRAKTIPFNVITGEPTADLDSSGDQTPIVSICVAGNDTLFRDKGDDTLASGSG